MGANKLIIESTEDTPNINFDFDSGILEISGRSLPENAWSFYQPIISWLDENLNHLNTSIDMRIELDYFNSSSGRFLLELLFMLEKTAAGNGHIKITWIAESEDELIIEKGEELKGMVNIPFEIITIK